MYLNDLDIIGDKIFINVYMTTYILELDLLTGKFLRLFLFFIFIFIRQFNFEE